MKKAISLAVAFILHAILYGQNSLYEDARYVVSRDDKAVEQPKDSSFLIRAVEWVIDDWIPLGNPETNRVDFGRIQTFPTYNPIEGVRLRVGLATNTRFSKHFFLKGYVAYGFGDQKTKYRGEVNYSFNKNVYHEGEFPRNTLSLIYENDLYSPGEMHPRSPNDLLLITYLRSENEALYRSFAEVNWEREYGNGIANTAWLRRSRMVPQGTLQFEYQAGGKTFVEDALNTAEAGLQLRYSMSEAYVERKRKRAPLNLDSPVFFLSHTIGMGNFPEGEALYHRSGFSAQKRFLLGTAGRLDVVGEVEKVWNSVPFPLLVYPNQRHRYYFENGAFFLSRAMEFVADEQVTLRATMVGNDMLLAKVPLFNVLQARELISFRASYGRLSEKNNPGNFAGYIFPAISHQYEQAPYVEGTVGITNILGLLRVEYVHRFTYRDHPDALLGKIRVDITL